MFRYGVYIFDEYTARESVTDLLVTSFAVANAAWSGIFGVLAAGRFDMPLDFSRKNEHYASSDEIVFKFAAVFDMRLYYLCKYRAWICPDDDLCGMMGITVSAEEFEGRLPEASDLKVLSRLSDDELETS